jgi:pyridinium-3,5-biscarboxylic acid mononucleotide sulfurtransferase
MPTTRGIFGPGSARPSNTPCWRRWPRLGLTKLEVRALAKAAGYPVWDRPAAPCLSSRVEYGRTVTREVLEQVERGEESLRQLGFRELRVRHHGELARVEIARDELPRALTMEMMDAITAALKQAGFKYVTLDCQGFRSGSMNAVLPVEVLARRGARSLSRHFRCKKSPG